DRREHVLGRLGWRADQYGRRPDPILERDRTRHLAAPALTRQMQHTVPASGGDSASVPGSRYGLGIFSIPLTCGGNYWSHEGDVPGYNTIGAVSSDGRTTVVLSLNSNVDDPVLAAEYGLVDHVMCDQPGQG